MTKIYCNVINCLHNEEEICSRDTLRVMTHERIAHSTEAVNCMSFQPESEASYRIENPHGKGPGDHRHPVHGKPGGEGDHHHAGDRETVQ